MALDRVNILNEETGDRFLAMFNPEEYSLNKDNNYASQAIPGLTSPILQFVHGNLQTLDMELFFDTFDTQADVRTRTSQIFNLLAINADLHTPPVLRVTWGTLDFRCVLAKVNQKFIRFFSDGRPGRARLTVTFNEYLDAATQVAQANLQSPDFSKAYTVKQGDTVSSIAAISIRMPPSGDPLPWQTCSSIRDRSPQGRRSRFRRFPTPIQAQAWY
jgi:hypothetical protein